MRHPNASSRPRHNTQASAPHSKPNCYQLAQQARDLHKNHPEINLSAAVQLVYVTLILFCNTPQGNTFQCWPSIKRIEQSTRLSRDSVFRAIKRLEALHLVTRINRGSANGGRKSNLYVLSLLQQASTQAHPPYEYQAHTNEPNNSPRHANTAHRPSSVDSIGIQQPSSTAQVTSDCATRGSTHLPPYLVAQCDTKNILEEQKLEELPPTGDSNPPERELEHTPKPKPRTTPHQHPKTQGFETATQRVSKYQKKRSPAKKTRQATQPHPHTNPYAHFSGKELAEALITTRQSLLIIERKGYLCGTSCHRKLKSIQSEILRREKKKEQHKASQHLKRRKSALIRELQNYQNIGTATKPMQASIQREIEQLDLKLAQSPPPDTQTNHA